MSDATGFVDRAGHLAARMTRRAAGRPRFEDLFRSNTGRLVHKVPHYFPVYEAHLRRFQNRRPTMLEIGVFHGGSLDLWQRYFGAGTRIVGIDIATRAEIFDAPERQIHVRIGDQSDPSFLASVAEEFGPFDIVLDDGSHVPRHQMASLDALWPHVRPGGVYLVEDLCASYWPEYEGAADGAEFMAFTRSLVDEVNAFNSRFEELSPSSWTREVTGVHVYDSIVAIDRGEHRPLTTELSGVPSFPDDDLGPDADPAIFAAAERRRSRRGAVARRLPEPVVDAAARVRRRLGS